MASENEHTEEILEEEKPVAGEAETGAEAAEKAEAAAPETPEEESGAEQTAGESEDVKPEDSAEAKEKRSFFRKKDKKDEKDLKIQELTDKLTRLMAEFDNYRKRTEKEKTAQFDMGVTKAVGKLLPVVDNFERGLTSVPEADRTHPAYTGMDLIYKQLVRMLDDLGVEAIDAEGKEFDPNLHNAVMQVESDGTKEENTVARVLQKGYTYKGSVVRYSAVSVFK